uniref:APO domain-containing protein n=2 Tax=Vitis vinifera TaxID=29760 RepID=A5ASM1_VITVI|nr:hypothetical protein VITISV_019164 [Vitis vinifera]
MGGRKSGGWKRLVKRLALMRCGESKHQKPTLRAICRGFSLRFRWWAHLPAGGLFESQVLSPGWWLWNQLSGADGQMRKQQLLEDMQRIQTNLEQRVWAAAGYKPSSLCLKRVAQCWASCLSLAVNFATFTRKCFEGAQIKKMVVLGVRLVINDRFGIVEGFMTTVYSITATQKIVDDPLMLDYNIAIPSEDMPAGTEVMAHTGVPMSIDEELRPAAAPWCPQQLIKLRCDIFVPAIDSLVLTLVHGDHASQITFSNTHYLNERRRCIQTRAPVGLVVIFRRGLTRLNLWARICNGMDAGVMLVASFDLVQEGQEHGIGNWVMVGILARGIFIWLCKKFLEQYGEVSMLDIKGAEAAKVVLVIGITTLHSFGEGEVISGKQALTPSAPSGDLDTFRFWADQIRHLKVMANADTLDDALTARNNGTQGSGLCRTEHMFFASDERMKALLLGGKGGESLNFRLLSYLRDAVTAVGCLQPVKPLRQRIVARCSGTHSFPLWWCNEIYVGHVGHPFKSCRGPQASIRKGDHEWTNAFIEDILVPVDAFRLFDRLGRRIPHEERFSIPRIPAVVELCIQAGVDLPEFPTKSEFIDADESELPDPVPEVPKTPLLTEIPDSEIEPPSSAEETALLAEETLKAWEKMKGGAKKLMRMYPAGAAVPEQYKPTMRLDVGIPTYIKEAEMCRSLKMATPARDGKKAGEAGAPKMPAAGQHSTEVLHQRSKLPHSPLKLAIGGLAFVAALSYFTLYTKKKPEASALDVAKVVAGVSTPEDTHPRK